MSLTKQVIYTLSVIFFLAGFSTITFAFPETCPAEYVDGINAYHAASASASEKFSDDALAQDVKCLSDCNGSLRDTQTCKVCITQLRVDKQPEIQSFMNEQYYLGIERIATKDCREKFLEGWNAASPRQ